jgi:hypothetical protein
VRDPISDCLAIAAMPGLEVLADEMEQAAPRKRASRRDNLSLLILAGASRAFASQEKAASAFAQAGLWPMLVASAARVGRVLPPRPPTADQLDKLLATHGPQLAVAVERALNRVAVELAWSMGLLTPGVPLSWDPLLREHHLTADGTVADTLSEVTETNKLHKSRAADPATGARVCDMYVGKNVKEVDKRGLGAPFVVVSTHGHLPHQRLVFGLETYQDANEVGAAMAVFDRVIPLTRGGVHVVHYDRLLGHSHAAQLMQRHGVIPIVEMRSANPKANLKLAAPVDDPRFRRGKHGQHDPKPYLQVQHYGVFTHPTPDGLLHQLRLWAHDGHLHVTGFDQKTPTLAAEPLRVIHVERRQTPTGYAMLVTYRVPCEEHGVFDVTIDITQKPRNTHKKKVQALQQVVGGQTRIVTERDPAFWAAAGRRSDSESTIDVIKDTMHLHGRATRLRLEVFLWDLVGAALLINAKAWDVHVAQHTAAGAREYAKQQRKAAA